MIQFKCNGRMKISPETDKFKPFEEKKFDSGWDMCRLFFNVFEGDNRHMMTIQGGYFPDKKDYSIKTIGASTVDDAGNKVKGGMVEIKWADRLKPENIKKVADFRKFVIDVEIPGRRTNLQHLADKIHEGTGVTDEELKQVGLTDESEVAEALKESKKLRKEFISEYDYAEFMHKLLSSEKYDNKLFYIKGNIEKQYSDMKGQWYTSLKPTRIYLANEGSDEYCTGTATLFFTDDAVDDSFLEEKGKYYVNAYTFEYDSTRKKNIPAEFQLVVPSKVPHQKGEQDGKDESRAKGIARKFRVDDGKVYEYGIEFDMLDGSQKVEITEDMLSDEQREDLDLGIITMDDIRAELGGSVYGDRVVENKYKKVLKGYSGGRKETVYDPDDLKIPPLDDGKTDDGFDSDDEDDDDDLFN